MTKIALAALALVATVSTGSAATYKPADTELFRYELTQSRAIDSVRTAQASMTAPAAMRGWTAEQIQFARAEGRTHLGMTQW